MNIGDSLLEKLLNTEYHFLRYQDKYILFTVEGSAILLNRQAATLIQLMIKEKSTDFIPQSILVQLSKTLSVKDWKAEPVFVHQNDRQWCPTVLLVSLTNGCSLRCIYCYARAGDFTPEFLKLNIFSTAIDMIARNAKKMGKEQFKIHFLGNGESTYNWQQFTEAIRIIKGIGRKYSLVSIIHVTTNGILNDRKRSFLVDNVDSLTLSIDGLSEHQNKLRPMPNGKPSWDVSFKTAQYFFNHQVKLNFRTTVSRINVQDLSKIVKFFSSIFPRVPIRFEPMHHCGRSLDMNIQPPAEDVFIREYLKAEECGREYDTNVSFSGVSAVAKPCNTPFCGISTTNFCLTETGLVTACFNGMSDLYNYGFFDADNEIFVVDKQKLSALRGLTLHNSVNCRECFARRYCLGDCPSIRITSSGENILEQYTKGIGRCKINKGLVLSRIVSSLKQTINPQDVIEGGETDEDLTSIFSGSQDH